MIVDAINEAINARKKIRFQKVEYNVKKERVLHHGGEEYVFSPYSLVWDGDFYYVVGYSDKYKSIGSHRVDRIYKRPEILDEAAVPPMVGFDINTYVNTMFRMYNSDRYEVELQVENQLMDASKDEAERTCISLIESSISDLVVAFQRVCECVYPQLEGALPLKRNVFQRINDGNALWVGLVGKGYQDWITPIQYAKLQRCFQQRHLLQHQDGVVDEEYIKKSGDSSYRVGQRLIIKERDVSEYADIIETLGNHVLAFIYGHREERAN